VVITPIDIATLAAGWVELDLDPQGTPQRPLVIVDLNESERPSDVANAARAARLALPLLVGVSKTPPSPSLQPLVDALDLTLVEGATSQRCCVGVGDPLAAAEDLARVVAANPRAAVALGHLLRQTQGAGVHDGLVAEAAAYSMLLAGSEFDAWLHRRGRPRPSPRPVSPSLDVTRDSDLLRITLARPERRNAVDATLRDALVEALTVAVGDPQLHVEVTGAGPDFSSGGDLDEFGSAPDVTAAYLVRLQRHPGFLLHQLRDRTTVRVHGACIGAGVEMPAFAGRVVAARDAFFALPEVGMGLMPGAGGTVSIPRRIGRWRTAWLALTGERIDAATALDWGLVDELEP
jgi:Enoyl-CoA hydratase/isomerase